jgi:hypothetical protein
MSHIQARFKKVEIVVADASPTNLGYNLSPSFH